VNNFYKSAGKESLFNINLFHLGQNTRVFSEAYTSQPIVNAVKQDIILIPAFNSDNIRESIMENTDFIPWLKLQYESGTEIGSFCTGAFLLAASGLLDGKKATTHIDSTTAFHSLFPSVDLQADAVLTDDSGIYTSGGATSSFHLLLHLLRKYCTEDTVVKVAKIFAIDMDRVQQSYFGTFTPDQSHGDELVLMAQRRIESAYQKAETIEDLIQDLPSSRRNVVRRFKQATGCTPIEYLQKTRIEAAKKLLEQTNQRMLEVMLNSGYNDPKAFRKVFRKSVGMTPTEYRDKFKVTSHNHKSVISQMTA
jgi:transcriptional regulator GlxA family with amidase domain